MRKRLSADNRRFENGSADRLRSHPLLVLTRTVSVEIVYSLDQIPPSLKGGVLSIGNFDGVHRGHAQILGRLQDHAAKLGGPAIVLTFDPHPLALLRPQDVPPALTTVPRKLELLAEQGIAGTFVFPTSLATLGLTAHEFFAEILLKHLSPKGMVEGPNFHFGRGRQGDVKLLAQFCAQAGMVLDVVPAESDGGQLISSSRIRALIEQGAVAAANAMLTRPYRMQGIVETGAARGRTIGFPTANLAGISTVLPATGVYGCQVILANDEVWPGAMNIGPSPTFGDLRRRVEVYLIGYRGDLYGQTLKVDVLTRIRDTRPFDSIDALKQQLAADAEQAKVAVEDYVMVRGPIAGESP